MDDPVDVDLGVVLSIHVAKATRLPMRPVESVVAEAGWGWWATATTARNTVT